MEADKGRMNELQEAIQAAQSEHGLTDREIGQLFGVCSVQVQRWKEGRSRPIPGAEERVVKILQAYKRSDKKA